MGTFCRRLFIAFSLLLFTASTVQAKRIPPRPVSPVVSGGVRYSADGDGHDQYVVATDTKSGKVLWKVKVFHTRIKPGVEEDNQWVFITDLKLVGNSLHVRDERSRCYLIDLTTRHAKRQQCDAGS